MYSLNIDTKLICVLPYLPTLLKDFKIYKKVIRPIPKKINVNPIGENKI